MCADGEALNATTVALTTSYDASRSFLPCIRRPVPSRLAFYTVTAVMLVNLFVLVAD